MYKILHTSREQGETWRDPVQSSVAVAPELRRDIPMAKKSVVKFSANFEHNLEDIEGFLTEREGAQAFDSLREALLRIK
jgi:hypothetical protein